MKKFATPAVVVAAALLVGGCTSLSPTEDPVFLRLTDLEARLLQLERRLQNDSLITLSTQVDQLRADIAGLRGAIEDTRFDVEENAQRQRDLYLDTDTRLRALETAAPGGAPTQQPGNVFAPGPAGAPNAFPQSSPQAATTLPPAGSPPFGGNVPPQGGAQGGGPGGSFGGGPAGAAPSAGGGAAAALPPAVDPPAPQLTGSDRENYDRAYQLLAERRDYEAANRMFSAFLASFPASPLAPNAQYWLAETYYVRDQFLLALPAFERVLSEYPASDKVPDALLKIGYVQDALGNAAAARTALQRVMQQYPNTQFARLASARLTQLNSAR